MKRSKLFTTVLLISVIALSAISLLLTVSQVYGDMVTSTVTTTSTITSTVTNTTTSTVYSTATTAVPVTVTTTVPTTVTTTIPTTVTTTVHTTVSTTTTHWNTVSSVFTTVTSFVTKTGSLLNSPYLNFNLIIIALLLLVVPIFLFYKTKSFLVLVVAEIVLTLIGFFLNALTWWIMGANLFFVIVAVILFREGSDVGGG